MRRWKKYGFLLALLTPHMPVTGYQLSFNAYTLLIGLGLIPILDHLVGEDRGNLPDAEEDAAFYRAITLAYVPLQLALQCWGVGVVSEWQDSAWQLAGFMLSVGFVAGANGITVAHELGHRKSRLERLLAKVLLVSVCYGHFTIEHNRGHHVRVATPEDPTSARFGEGFYAFLPRTVFGSYLHAWALEFGRMRRLGLHPLSRRNEMLWYTALPLAILVGFWWGFGPVAAAFYLVQSAMAVCLLEAVNYIEHYGLTRRKLANGRYERATHLHAWNSSRLLTNWFLFHLQRHSDHHEEPGRRYPSLRHFDESPQLPTGYSGMILLALVPPLWRAVMDRRVQEFYTMGGPASRQACQRSSGESA